jgi:hypothetical protein
MALLGFVDLLGFSASINAQWQDANSPLERLLRIKDTALKAQGTTIVRVPTNEVPPRTGKPYRSRIHTVSDSIVICNALPPDDVSAQENILTDSLSILFANIQFIWQSAATEGYAIRGAIELGDIYWTSEDTIGPALVASHDLESKISKYSRVILGPSLLQEIIKQHVIRGNMLGSLAVGADRLIELVPSLLGARKENLERFEEMQRNAPTAKDKGKYEDLLSLLRGEKELRLAGQDDLQFALSKLSTT